MLGNFPCFFGRLLTVFQMIFFQEHYQCQTVWIQIKTDVLSVLIWVQTICKGYQQTTKVAVSLDLGPNCLQRLLADEKSPLMIEFYLTIFILIAPSNQFEIKPFSQKSQQLSSALSSAYILRKPILQNNMDPDKAAPKGSV